MKNEEGVFCFLSFEGYPGADLHQECLPRMCVGEKHLVFISMLYDITKCLCLELLCGFCEGFFGGVASSKKFTLILLSVSNVLELKFPVYTSTFLS